MLKAMHADAEGHKPRWYRVTIKREKRRDAGMVFLEACCLPKLVETLQHVVGNMMIRPMQTTMHPQFIKISRTWEQTVATKVNGKPGTLVIERAEKPADPKLAYVLLPAPEPPPKHPKTQPGKPLAHRDPEGQPAPKQRASGGVASVRKTAQNGSAPRRK